MSTDTQRAIDFLLLFHFMWLSPIQIVIAIILLWQQLGIAALSGVVLMLILMPMNFFFGRVVKNIATNIMKNKDKRVKLMNEILNGIKVFKLYAWETSFRDKVFGIRQYEV